MQSVDTSRPREMSVDAARRRSPSHLSGGRGRSGRRHSVPHREHDVAAVRLVARGRVVVATVAVIVGSLLRSEGPGSDAFLYVLGVFWVPWSGWLALDADRQAPRFTRLAGAAGDMVVLLALGALIDGWLIVVGTGSGIVVLMAAYSGSALEGVGLSATALTIFTLASYRTPPDVPRPVLLLLYAGVLGTILVVLERGSSQRRRVSAQSERLLGRSAAVLERVADGVIVTDPRGYVLEANPAARRIMAGTDARSGRHCDDMLGLQLGERALDCSRGCALLRLDGKEGDGGREVWRTTPEGRRQPLLANVCAITNDLGEVDEVVHSLRDITTLKQADEAKTLFLAMASHELKTPLTVIRGFGEMLLDSPGLDDQASRAAEVIVRRTEELSTIVDGLLLSSRIEAGRLELVLCDVQVAPILRERGESLAGATGRAVRVEVPADLPEVRADPAAVTTVVDHLLDNAVKYSPGGGPVTVLAQADHEEVRVQVIDTGVGMDSEQATRCFDKFWQADSTDQRRFRGTGIGLYIVRSLVEGMGGTIGVDSARGRGTTFTVTLRRWGAGADPEGSVLAGEDSIVREFMRQLGLPAVRR